MSASDWSPHIYYLVHAQTAKCIMVRPPFLAMINTYDMNNQKRELANKDGSTAQKQKVLMVEVNPMSNTNG